MPPGHQIRPSWLGITEKLTKFNVPLDAIIQAVLLYTQTNSQPDKQVKRLLDSKFPSFAPVTEKLAPLYKELAASFWSDIYVERLEYAEIKSRVDIGFDGSIIIKGYAGCGNSTLVRKLEHDLRGSLNTIFFIIDPMARPELFENKRATIRDYICRAMYETIREAATASKPGLLSTFNKYLIFSDKSLPYMEFRDKHDIQFTPDYLGQNLSDELSSQQKRYHFSIGSLERLFSLLEFLQLHDIRVYVCFDNIDRLAIWKHDVIVELAAELVRGSPPQMLSDDICPRGQPSALDAR
ncbi:MAG: hypothetical protein FJX62_16590 [Alphaproteobacteria bacterium]|nr:hypothetical protein [Alphaproteobacteria bacterium]